MAERPDRIKVQLSSRNIREAEVIEWLLSDQQALVRIPRVADRLRVEEHPTVPDLYVPMERPPVGPPPHTTELPDWLATFLGIVLFLYSILQLIGFVLKESYTAIPQKTLDRLALIYGGAFVGLVLGLSAAFGGRHLGDVGPATAYAFGLKAVFGWGLLYFGLWRICAASYPFDPAEPPGDRRPTQRAVVGLVTVGAVLLLLVVGPATVGTLGGSASYQTSSAPVETTSPTQYPLETQPPAGPGPSGAPQASATLRFTDGTAKASVVKDPASGKYEPRMVLDGEKSTAWCWPAPAVGASITISYPSVREISLVRILPGYAKVHPQYGDVFTLNNRVKRVKVTFPGGGNVSALLNDSETLQDVPVSPAVRSDRLSIIVEEVYPTSRWTDTGISEIEVSGRLVTPKFQWPAQRDKEFHDLDLDGLSARELDLLRNEIYARHGRKFRASDLQEYFAQQSWYRTLDHETELQGKEQANAAIIAGYQEHHGMKVR
ncbi:MAG: YARHG domain-containing protein [Armatimonadota bacterium]